MAITIHFKGVKIRYPSGSGLSTKPCPSCGEKRLCVQYGTDWVLDKPFHLTWCSGCKYSKGKGPTRREKSEL